MNHLHYPGLQEIHDWNKITVRRNQHSHIIRAIPSRAYEIGCHPGINTLFFSAAHIGTA